MKRSHSSESNNSYLSKQQDAFKQTLLRSTALAKSASTGNMTTGGRPLNSLIFAIIGYLKSLDRSATFEELRNKLNIDIETIPELLERVCKNERVLFQRPNTLSYLVFTTILLVSICSRPSMSGERKISFRCWSNSRT